MTRDSYRRYIGGMSFLTFSIVPMYGLGGVKGIMTQWTGCTKGQHTWCLYKKTWFTPSNEVLNELSWPSLEKLLWKASCCMVYKCVNQLTPQIIYDKLTFNDNVKSRPTRDTGKMLLRPPHCHTEFYKRSFFVSACDNWNNLPLTVKESPSITSFKRNLNVL